jgi:GNAT superfamily N-acetyltransferase
MRQLATEVRTRIAVRTRLRHLLATARRPRRLGAEDAALVEHVLDSLGNYHRLVCAATPTARLLEQQGVVAAVVPAMRERSANAVVYKRTSALVAALDELAATYDEAGVDAWIVWVPAADGDARKLLKRAGYRLHPNFTAMARELRRFQRPVNIALENWTAAGDPAVMAAIADPDGWLLGPAFTRAFYSLPQGSARIYLGSLDGEPASCLMTRDEDGNCAVDLVATLPEARGQGLASSLLAQALADAAERGCVTTTLVSTRMARSVYERLGFRALCPLQQWERRHPSRGVAMTQTSKTAE